MNKCRSLVVAALVLALVAACLLALCRPQCKAPTLGSWLGISGPWFAWPFGETKTPTETKETQETKVTRTLVGSGDELIITVPPNKDTVRIRVDEKLHVVAIPESAITVVRRVPLIRFRPTLHVSVLAPPASFLTPRSYASGAKLRAVEIGRFGITGYVTSKGPGAGVDCRVLGNLSLDAACIWRIDRWALPPAPMARTLYVGLSLRL